MVITSLRNSEGEDFNIYLVEIIEATDQLSNTKPKDKLEKSWMYHTNAITTHLMWQPEVAWDKVSIKYEPEDLNSNPNET